MVVRRRVLANDAAMKTTIQQRLETLEKTVKGLRATVLGLTPAKKNWRSTVGTLKNSKMAREAARFGQEYRKQQNVL